MIENYDRVNTENFQQFLNDFSQKYPKDFHVVQTDNARFHCSNDLIMPDNVMLLYQPPHSPQVNPSEQLWQWSKGEISNKLFTGIDHLKTTLSDLFKSKPKGFFASLTSRNFILCALQKIGILPIIIYFFSNIWYNFGKLTGWQIKSIHIDDRFNYSEHKEIASVFVANRYLSRDDILNSSYQIYKNTGTIWTLQFI